MRKLFCWILIIAMLLSSGLIMLFSSPLPVTGSTEELYADDEDYTGFVGRLHVPDAGIDVALYRGADQSITDRADSANIFALQGYPGEIIADHYNQEFAGLFAAEVGMHGCIHLRDGDVIYIECVDVFNGHNTGYDLTDEAGVSVIGREDYAMYTCRNGWRNVLICLWDTI